MRLRCCMDSGPALVRCSRALLLQTDNPFAGICVSSWRRTNPLERMRNTEFATNHFNTTDTYVRTRVLHTHAHAWRASDTGNTCYHHYTYTSPHTTVPLVACMSTHTLVVPLGHTYMLTIHLKCNIDTIIITKQKEIRMFLMCDASKREGKQTS